MRCAVTVLLICSLPSLILAQHHPGGGSSGSSSSGGSAGGYSGSSSGGGYSGGSSASSGGGHSGGSSGGYNGGSSGSHSSSSASSGSSSGGGSHSSGSSGSSRSGGSSASSASSSRSPEAGRAGSPSSLPQSNLRHGDASSEHTSLSRENFSSRGNFGGEASYSQVFHDAGNQAFSVESLVGYNGNDFNKALKSGSLNPILLQLGLEPSRKAYDAAVASADRSAGFAPPKNPNWFSRAILGKRKAASAEPGLAMLPKPCLAAGCPPAPRPPKPCVGKNCKPAPPPLPPGGCHSGVAVGGACRPWGYLNNCHRRGSCSVQFAPVDTSYCVAILARIRQLQMLAKSQGVSCAANSQGPECVFLKDTNAQIAQSMQQYRMCTMGTHSGLLGFTDDALSIFQTGILWP